jgi:hypothetical protein
MVSKIAEKNPLSPRCSQGKPSTLTGKGGRAPSSVSGATSSITSESGRHDAMPSRQTKSVPVNFPARKPERISSGLN